MKLILVTYLVTPTLFAIFINSLAEEIKKLNCGVKIAEENLDISILLFADDIVLTSSTEEGLQAQLNTLSEWTKKHRMSVNMDKTRIVHFRPTGTKSTGVKFTLGEDEVEHATQYKYLGITLNENLNYNRTVELLTA